jgi:acyl-coenzyme A thioesterase PaaI-like protein
MSAASEPSLQDRYAYGNLCFGCGPANEKGLRIKSYLEAGERDVLVCRFRPEAHHIAFPGVVNGGILGTLLDCHSNWCAAHALLVTRGVTELPCTVTADFHVKLKRPTPLVELVIRARPLALEADRAEIDAVIEADGVVTATCRGTFVAVKEGHPAFHRW